MKTIGLYASLRIRGANTDVKEVITLFICIEPAQLCDGIRSFTQKVENIILEKLYLSLGENGKIFNSILLDVTHFGGNQLDYRQEIREYPSSSLYTRTENIISNIMSELEKDLTVAIVNKEEFKTLKISRHPKNRG